MMILTGGTAWAASEPAAVAPPEVMSQEAFLHWPEQYVPGLRAVVDKTLQQSPRVLDQQLSVLVATERETETRRGLLYPRAGAYVDGQERHEVRNSGGSSSMALKTYYSVEMSQPLYHWNALRNRARMAEIQKALSLGDVEEARRNLVLEVRQSYLGLIFRRLEYQQAHSLLENNKGGLNFSEQRASRGELPPQVLAEERLTFEQNKINVERAERELERAKADFALLSGIKDLNLEELPRELPPMPDVVAVLKPRDPLPPVSNQLAPPAFLARAVGDRDTAKLSYEVERVRLRPKFSVVLGTTEEEVNYSADLGNKYSVQAQYIALRVNWDIFDGFAVRAAKRRTLAELRQKNIALDQATEAMSRRLRADWEDLTFAQRELAVAEARFAQTQAHMKEDEPRRASGDISGGDWWIRSYGLEQERIALLRVRSQQLLRIAEYALLVRRSQLPSSQIGFP